MSDKPQRRLVKRAEALAIRPDALHTGPDAMWWLFCEPAAKSARCDDVAIVNIRGPLEHHGGWGDSYEAILERVRDAMSGEDVVRQAKRDSYWDAEPVEVPPAVPAKCVVLRIDSPGGVCSGLNETVFALRRMSQDTGVPLYAYVDELAASAAYALACACEEIYAPASGIAGSIGVISALFDQTKADQEMGLRVEVITSGARKSDGNPHVAITDDAVSAEQGRVDRLARQFYDLVSEARPLSIKAIAKLEAGIFVGAEAFDRGLVDGVMGWDELLAVLKQSEGVNENDIANVGQVGSTWQESASQAGAKGSKMSQVAILALVKQTKAAIAAEKNAKKKAALTAQLNAYQATADALKKEKYVKETHEKETTEEVTEDAEAAEGEAEGSADGETSDASESAGDPPDDEGDDDDKDEGDAKKASASLADLAFQVTGKRGRSAVGALAAVIEEGKRAAASVRAIEKERATEKKSAMVTQALNARRITRHEAKTLHNKDFSFVKAFLEMRPHAIINVDDDTIRVPDPDAKADASLLPPDVVKAIDAAASVAPDAKARADLRAKMIEEHHKRTNGAGRH